MVTLDSTAFGGTTDKSKIGFYTTGASRMAFLPEGPLGAACASVMFGVRGISLADAVTAIVLVPPRTWPANSFSAPAPSSMGWG